MAITAFQTVSRLSVAIALALLASCNIGPKYIRPSVPVTPAYKESDSAWKSAQPNDIAARGQWWIVFHDPALNDLEEKLNASNQSIAAAVANVQAARALVREARAQYFPTVTLNPGITNSRISTGLGQNIGVKYTTYSLPFDVSWEPDLWGQDSIKRLLDSTASAYQESLGLTQDLFKAGVGTDQDVAQAEAQWKITQAQDTNLGVLRAQYEHAIALLMGQPPAAFTLPPEVIASVPPCTPVGVPSELLERRPDIAAAERAVAIANLQIGIAETAFFPNVTLSASAGLQSLSIAKWFEWPSRIWSVGPGVSQTILDGGLRKATVQQYQATYEQTVANYRQTVLVAFQQVEDALASLRILSQAIDEQDSAVESSRRSFQEEDVRYRSGLDPYSTLIIAQATLLDAQQAAVTFRMQRMTASVQLITALGGGWSASQIPTPKQMGLKAP